MLRDKIEAKANELLQKASEIYENSPSSMREIPFLFLLREEEIIVHPVRIELDPLIVEAARSFADLSGPYLEQIALRILRENAANISPHLLVGVGYLFPATGDFPASDLEAAQARLLYKQGGIATPWTKEGVVLLLDTPNERLTWAALRPMGEPADPLSTPTRWRVEATHIGRLYPHRPPDWSWN